MLHDLYFLNDVYDLVHAIRLRRKVIQAKFGPFHIQFGFVCARSLARVCVCDVNMTETNSLIELNENVPNE